MKKWSRSGLVWGGILYILTMLAFPLLDGERLSVSKLLLGIPFWIVMGIIIAYLFKNNKHKKRA